MKTAFIIGLVCGILINQAYTQYKINNILGRITTVEVEGQKVKFIPYK